VRPVAAALAGLVGISLFNIVELMYPVRPFVAIAATRSGSVSVVSAVPSDCSRSFVSLSISTTERACGVPVNSVRCIWGNCDTPEVSDSVVVRHLWFALWQRTNHSVYHTVVRVAGTVGG